MKKIYFLNVCLFCFFVGGTAFGQSCTSSYKDSIVNSTSSVYFTSTGGGTRWEWNFGDNTALSYLKNPNHSYAAVGNYNVCLTVSDSISCFNKFCSTLSVKPACQWSPYISNGLISDGFLHFDYTYQNYGYIQPNRWAWNFGDGGVSSVQNPNHAFKTSGPYNVCVTASDSTGTCSQKSCQKALVAPGWTSSKVSGRKGDDFGTSIRTDIFGNVYYTGTFKSPTISFGTFTLTNTDTSSSDIFIVKQDSKGKVLWAKSAGGKKDDKSNGISCDALGNVFITGYFYSDSITFGTTTLKNLINNYSTYFLIKYDSSGAVVWAKNSKNISGNAVTCASNGDVLVTGGEPNGSADFFVKKYDSNGNLYWSNIVVGDIHYQSGNSYGGAASGLAITTDLDNNVYVTGAFICTITFDTVTVVSNGGCNIGGIVRNIFTVKYNKFGRALWAKPAGGLSRFGDSYGTTIGVDAFGNVVISGLFRIFGPGDLYMAKYEGTKGKLLRENRVVTGISSNMKIASLDIDLKGNIYLASNIANSNQNMYCAKFDTSGSLLWSKTVVGALAAGICLDPNKNIYVLGSFTTPSVSFDITLYNAGINTSDIFLAKIGCNGFLTKPLITPSGPFAICTGDSVKLHANAVGIWNTGSAKSDVFIKNSGTYYFSSDSAAGCATPSNFVGVTVNPGKPFITTNGNKLFSNIIGPALQWYLNGTAVKDSVNPAFTAKQSGTFTVKASQGGCSVISDPFIYKVPLGLINETNDLGKFSVYPNPGTGLIAIESLSVNGENNAVQVQVADVMGRVYAVPIIHETNKVHLNMAALAPGLYLLKVSEEKRIGFLHWIKTED